MKFRPIHWVIAAVVIASFPLYWWYRWHHQLGYTNGIVLAGLAVAGLYVVVGHGLPKASWGRAIHWLISTLLAAAPATYWWWRYQAQPGLANGIITASYAAGSVFVFLMFEFSVSRSKQVESKHTGAIGAAA